MNTQLSPKEWQLLSAYLDGQLTERERHQVEQQLSARPALSTALDEMRINRAVLRRLPVRKVPHNFILTREMAAAAARRTWYSGMVPVLRLSSVLSTAFLILTLFAGTLLRTPASMPMAQQEDALRAAGAAEEAPMEPAAAIPAEAQSAIGTAEDGAMLWWGGPLYVPYATGMGGIGGGDGTVYGKGGGGGSDMALPEGSSMGQLPNIYHPPTELYGGGMAEAVPAPALPAPETAQEPAPQSTDFGDGPILGLADADRQGEALAQPVVPPAAVDTAATVEDTAAPAPVNFRVVQVGLIALALVTGLAAVWLHRKTAR